jgi:hypothetical protein
MSSADYQTKSSTIVSSEDDIHSASDMMVRRENYSFRAGWYWIILVVWRLLRRGKLGIRINGDADGDMPFMGMMLLRWLLFDNQSNFSSHPEFRIGIDIGKTTSHPEALRMATLPTIHPMG